MNTVPKISYLVPVYNAEPYIEECARSLFEQTLDDLEYVFVIDGSPDNSLEVLQRTTEEYPNRKPHVKIIVFPENRGIHAARRAGFEHSTGTYVHFMDSDDYLDIHAAEITYNRMEERQDDLLFFDYQEFYPDHTNDIRMFQSEAIGDGSNLRDDVLNMRIWSMGWVRVMRRSVMADNDIVWPVRSMGDDTVYGTMMVYYAKRIDYIHDQLYHYRVNPNSICRTPGAEAALKRFYEFQENMKVYEAFLKREHIDKLYARGTFLKKMSVKNFLLPLISERKYQRLWLRTYPEANWVLLFGSRYFPSTYREKAWLIAMALGLFPRFQRRLMGRRFILDKFAF